MFLKSKNNCLIWIMTIAMLVSIIIPFSFATSESIPAGNAYYLAINGSDTNAGTVDAPFGTLTYAVSKLSNGDTLIIREGTYRGYFAIISKSNITIKSYDGEKVTLQNGDYKAGYVGYIGTSSNITISGFTFYMDDAGIQGNMIFVDTSDNVKITNCDLSRGEGGIVARNGTTNLEISNNILHGFTWPYGSVLLYNSSNSRIFNNLFYGSYFGINTYGSGTVGNIVYNNTFYGNDVDIGGANIGGIPANNVFRNNIFSSRLQNQNHDDPSALIDNFVTGLNSFDYNFYNNIAMSDGIITNDGLTIENLQAAGAETNGTAGNPRFLNPVTTDFQPGRGSDAEGKGDAKYLPASDMLGMIGSGSYAGAYVPVNRTYYYVSNSGNNSSTGSDTDPFATISYALGVMAPGDYLYIKAGTYDEAASISGKDSLVLKNYQKDQPVINGGITVQDSQNITVGGFTLTKTVKIAGGKNITVSNMDVNGASVIVVPGTGNSSTDGYEISSSYIHAFQGEGALLVYNGKNGAIINNVIYSNAKQGILLEGGECKYNNIYNNTFYGNTSDLCLVYANSIGNPIGNTFKNNLFSSLFEIGNSNFFTTNTFDYNLYNKATMTDTIGYANVYDDQGAYVTTDWPTVDTLKSMGAELNGFLGNPAFLNAANNDFRLRANSEAVGRGTSLGAPSADILGLRRTEPYDIGAYKFTNVINEYYVAVDGDDSNTGSSDSPLKTIQQAVDRASAGETIYIRGGIYDQQVVISNRKGDASNVFTIKAAPGETPVLSSSGKQDTAVIIDRGSGFWKIEGLKIQDYSKSGVEIRGDSDNVTLSNLEVSNIGGNGIYIENSDNAAIENVKSINTVNGIKFSGAAGWSIYRTLADKAAEAAVDLNASSGKLASSIMVNSKTGLNIAGSQGLIVYNNDFYGNLESDLKLGENSTGNTLKNNIFGSANSLYSVEIADLNNDLDYNCYNKVNNREAVYYTSSLTLKKFVKLGKEANGIEADPSFTDPAAGNFILSADSLCSDKGIKDENTPITGYDGYSFETPVDMGAIFSPYSLQVYYVSPRGDDNNEGSIDHPWKTIKKGMNSLKASDTLYIRGGVYNERINIDGINGRASAYITVKNYQNEEVILNSQFNENVGMKFTNSSYWRIDGLKFTEYVGAGIWAASGSHHIIMENLEIWNIDNKEPHSSGTEGILGDGSTYCTVRNSYIHDISETLRSDLDNGIYIGYGAHHWVFDSNRIDNAPGSGLNFYGKPSGGDDCVITNNVISNCKYGMVLTLGMRNKISNNTLINNWEYDLYMDWWYNDSIIQNNIFYNDLPVGTTVKALDKEVQQARDYVINPATIAVLYDQVNGNIFRNNVFFNKYFGNRIIDIKTMKTMEEYLASQQLNTFENNQTADPLFSGPNGGDFTLQSGSPCIDAGNSDQAPAMDYTGEARTGLPDIGAYEYIPHLDEGSESTEG